MKQHDIFSATLRQLASRSNDGYLAPYALNAADKIDALEAYALAARDKLEAAERLVDRVEKAQGGWPHRQGWVEDAITAYRAAGGGDQ